MFKPVLVMIIVFFNIAAFDGKSILPLDENSSKDTSMLTIEHLKLNYDKNFYDLGKYHSAQGTYTTVISSIGIIVSVLGIIAADGWNTELLIPSSIYLGASSAGLVFGIFEIRLGSSLQNIFLTRH